ncbi:MAG: DNA primase, partial [Geminicoccaceae bacterium]|nr:DNA primase [Geminicoccaceae bacterium]
LRDDGDGSLETFKSRISLADIVGRYVRLTRKGREHSGLCPFHKEKSPSFSVVEEKGFYHCFGCGAHGDVIRFIMEIEGLGFPEALARLADMTGIEPPAKRGGTDRIAPDLADANAAAMRWFEGQLETGRARAARAYLERRGVGAGARERFRLGYAPPDRHALREWLVRNGIAEQIAVDAGLLIRPDDGSACYDRFRERLVFPIEDMRGRIVGFGGRALAEQKAKYLNSPETRLFHKGTLLFGLPLASRAAKGAGRIVLVEGYMDVIALHENGIAETVAPLGTAVTEEQLQLLWRYSDEPVVCLDGDKAGFAAALRAIRRALPVMKGGQSLRFALLPEGEDPDSFVRSRGRDAMDSLLSTAMPLSRLVWQAEWTARPVTTPEQLAGLRKRLLDYAGLARDPTLAAFLRDQFDELVNARRPRRYGPWRRESGQRGSRGGNRGGAWERSPQLAAFPRSPEQTNELRALACFLLDPGLISEFETDLAELDLADPAHDRLRSQLLAFFAERDDLDPETVRHHLTGSGFGEIAGKVMSAFGPMTAGGSIDRQAAAGMLEQRRSRLARERVAAETAAALQEGRMDELDTCRLSQDELLNGPPDGDPPGRMEVE